MVATALAQHHDLINLLFQLVNRHVAIHNRNPARTDCGKIVTIVTKTALFPELTLYSHQPMLHPGANSGGESVRLGRAVVSRTTTGGVQWWPTSPE